MIKIEKDVQQVAQELQEIAKANPEQVIYECKYAWQGQPNCIVGVWLNKYMNVSVNDLEQLDDYMDSNGASDVINLRRSFALAASDSQVIDLLQVVQSRQDSQMSWAAAVDTIEQVLV